MVDFKPIQLKRLSIYPAHPVLRRLAASARKALGGAAQGWLGETNTETNRNNFLLDAASNPGADLPQLSHWLTRAQRGIIASCHRRRSAAVTLPGRWSQVRIIAWLQMQPRAGSQGSTDQGARLGHYCSLRQCRFSAMRAASRLLP
jgi:hypothetical protein